MNHPDYVITLVHGTFAKNADWCKPTSDLYSALTAHFPNRCIISAFPWSGKNGHSARLEAGGELINHLFRLTEEYPRSAHFVIAHSHGGNVVSYALRNEALQSKIRGIVYLATPHLECRLRELNEGILPLGILVILVYAISVAVPLAVVTSVIISITGNPTETGWWVVFILYCSLLLGLLIWTWRRMVGLRLAQSEAKILAKIRLRQVQIEKRYSPPFLKTPGILNVSTPLDEARFHLRFLRSLAGIPFNLWNPGLLQLLCRLYVLAIPLYLWFFWIPKTARELSSAGVHNYGSLRIAGTLLTIPAILLVSYVVLGLVGLSAQVLMLLMPKTIRSHFIGFGGETMLDNFLVDITLSDTPFAAKVENWDRLIVPLDHKRRWARLPALRLAHCAIYDDTDVIAKILVWISATATGQTLKQPLQKARSAANPLGL